MNSRAFNILIVAGTGAVTLIALLFKLLRPGFFPRVEGFVLILLISFLTLGAAVRIIKTSTSQQGVLFAKGIFLRAFWVWFCIGVGFFILANLIGISQGKIRFRGIPLEFYPTLGQDFFALVALGLDVTFGLGHSYLLGLAMGYHRASLESARECSLPAESSQGAV